MDDTPPRRSRRQNDGRKDSTFPLIPFLIGVVVLGFVIGAGLSMAGRHGSQRQVAAIATETPEPTATPEPTLAPLATARPEPSVTDDTTASNEPESPEPTATAAATVKPQTKPSAKPSPRPALASLPPSAAPSEGATEASSTPLAAPVTPAPLHSHGAAVVAHVKPAPPALSTIAPNATQIPSYATTAAPAAASASAPAAPANATIEADSDFGRLSANVVKQYLRALERGDTESAAGAFQPGSSTAYPERPILDSTAQIGTISSRGSNDTQTVNATISNSSGSYLGTYTVRRTPTGAAVIVSHSISKN